MGFLDTVSEETKKATDEFIRRLKQGRIVRRREPVMGYGTDRDNYLEEASKSFNNLISSEGFENIMKQAYE